MVGCFCLMNMIECVVLVVWVVWCGVVMECVMELRGSDFGDFSELYCGFEIEVKIE